MRRECPEASAGWAFRSFSCSEIDGTTGNNGRNRVLVNHLGNGIAQQHNILIERFDLALKLDAVDEVDRHRHMLTAQSVEERVLQQLTFVIAHDIFRVQELIGLHLTTRDPA
jgi:hypothetical protein